MMKMRGVAEKRVRKSTQSVSVSKCAAKKSLRKSEKGMKGMLLCELH